MTPDEEILANMAADLERRRASQPKRDAAKKLAPKIPPAISAEREAELNRRREHAERLEREARVAHGLRQLDCQRGKRYWGCRLSNFEFYPDEKHSREQREIVAKLHDYCQNIATNAADAYGVWLYGPCGTGKDHLAMAVARAFVQTTAEQVRWVCGAELFMQLRDSFDSDVSEARILSPLMGAPMLWLSDPLPIKGEFSPHQASTLYTIIERRYSARRPTIITANLAPGEADEKFGAAIARRLRETCLNLHCNWPSYRKPA